jgi:hypothetical protein
VEHALFGNDFTFIQEDDLMRRSWKLGGIGAAAALALLLQTQPIAAQSTGANLNGRAVDEQAGALPGVSITAKAASSGDSCNLVHASTSIIKTVSRGDSASVSEEEPMKRRNQ